MLGFFQRKRLLKHIRNILIQMLQLDKKEYSPYILGKLEGMVILIEQNLKGKNIDDIYSLDMIAKQHELSKRLGYSYTEYFGEINGKTKTF